MVESMTVENEPATTTFVLTAGLVNWLRREAKARGTSMSDLVRTLIDEARKEQAV